MSAFFTYIFKHQHYKDVIADYNEAITKTLMPIKYGWSMRGRKKLITSALRKLLLQIFRKSRESILGFR